MIVVFHNVARGGLTLLLWLQAESRAKHVTSFTTTSKYIFALCMSFALLLLGLSTAATALVLVRLSVVSARCCAHHGSHL